MTCSLAERTDIDISATTDASSAPPGHTPVLLRETIELLSVRPGGSYLDATFGGGGHTQAILDRSAPSGLVVALDADPKAIERADALAARYPGRLIPRQGNFSDMADLSRSWMTEDDKFDGILMDLGLSSLQLDDDARGFSFRSDAPLDMRFDPSSDRTAAYLVNSLSSDELSTLLFEYGEEPQARRIARAIVARREQQPIATAHDLAELIEQATGGRHGRKIHPATRTFQALRIAVNDELEALKAGLAAAIELLRPTGRLAVISFHSLEDRIVKQAFRQEARDCICPPGTPICICGHEARLKLVTTKPLRPTEHEARANPRSRSARLRVAERLA
ncbi:MAG TPA: 16S rRNA (cytosine(1402)-N(4))-methyltransferase RsmH [Thermomicrobiaceae bacterium]|nr:16S rRNA (cytosine(1402)-N(4))-methyltransferase RsmH [Thermomicrobiaceae bacterium]